MIWASKRYFVKLHCKIIKSYSDILQYTQVCGMTVIDRKNVNEVFVDMGGFVGDTLDWLDNLKLGYKFCIRHHSVRDTETVLYAVCDD